MNKIWIGLLATLLAVGYLVEVPGLSVVSSLVIHIFLLGFVARLWIQRKSGSVIIESVLLSLVVTTAIGLLLGNFFTVADLGSRLFMLGILLVGALMKRKEIETAVNRIILELKKEGQTYLLIVGATAIPFFIIFLANPTYGLISDGWWHCSIYNTVTLDTLPPSNPWYSGESLGYPYAYHVYLAYAARMLHCLDGLNLFAFLVAASAMLGIYALGKETFGKKKIAIIAALAFLFISHAGGIVFLYDLIRLLPTLGLEGYFDFLKSVHGPHVYYGHLRFLDFSVLIPFQMASMMAVFHFGLLVALLYFLFKRAKIIVGLALGGLFATNPVVGILGGLTTALFVLFTGEWKRIAIWIGAAILALLVAGNYIQATLEKMQVIGGEISSVAGPSLLLGFLLGYIALIVLAVPFFRTWKRTPTYKLWLSFILAAIIGIIAVGKLTDYIYTNLIILLAVATAPVWTGILKEPRKHLLGLGLLLVLIIPTFLVVGSYSYYKIPLSQEELDAAAWIEKNTEAHDIFLVSMDLTQSLNIHQYVTVFAKRRIYLGDPGLMKTYGEDTEAGVETYKQIFEQKDAQAICNAKEKGIDYIYANKEEAYLSNSCLEEVYQNKQIRIYATE